MAMAKGKNSITLNSATLCEIVSEWLNSGGPFAKNPVKVTDLKATSYNESYEFAFTQSVSGKTEKESVE